MSPATRLGPRRSEKVVIVDEGGVLLMSLGGFGKRKKRPKKKALKLEPELEKGPKSESESEPKLELELELEPKLELEPRLRPDEDEGGKGNWKIDVEATDTAVIESAIRTAEVWAAVRAEEEAVRTLKTATDQAAGGKAEAKVKAAEAPEAEVARGAKGKAKVEPGARVRLE